MGRLSPLSAGDHTGGRCTRDRRAAPALLLLMLSVAVVLQAGCTSAITSASLREALRQTAASLSSGEHAAASQPADTSADEPRPAALATDEIEEPVPSLEEAIDRAVTRLARSGGVDDATRAVLVQTLQATRPRDWPAVVDEFVVALEAGRESAGDTAPVEEAPAAEPSATGETAAAALRFPATTAALAIPEPTAAVAVSVARPIDTAPRTIEPDVDPIEPAEPADSPGPAAPSPDGPVVRNACFASRVKAWGVVDRFPHAAFHPGQEVLVYFELENLLARQSAAGHTTGVDTAFRLVAPDDTVVEEWTFTPLIETCHSPRRDYFVRYFLTIPDDIPAGQYRLEFLVSDTLAGGSTEESLDLDVIPRR